MSQQLRESYYSSKKTSILYDIILKSFVEMSSESFELHQKSGKNLILRNKIGKSGYFKSRIILTKTNLFTKLKNQLPLSHNLRKVSIKKRISFVSVLIFILFSDNPVFLK